LLVSPGRIRLKAGFVGSRCLTRKTESRSSRLASRRLMPSPMRRKSRAISWWPNTKCRPVFTPSWRSSTCSQCEQAWPRVRMRRGRLPDRDRERKGVAARPRRQDAAIAWAAVSGAPPAGLIAVEANLAARVLGAGRADDPRVERRASHAAIVPPDRDSFDDTKIRSAGGFPPRYNRGWLRRGGSNLRSSG